MSGRPDPAEWSGEEYGLQFPDGTVPALAEFVRARLDDYEAQAKQAARDGASRVNGVTY